MVNYLLFMTAAEAVDSQQRDEDLNRSKSYLTPGDTMEFAIAKISTKGQLVIPGNMRKDIKTGDEFLIIKDEGRLILKSVKSLAKDVKEDLAFAKRVENTWADHDKGRFVTTTKEKFLEELRRC